MKKKKNRTPELVAELKEWLRHPENSTAKLAVLMRYKHSSAITQWIIRGRVPEREEEEVKQIIRGK